MFLLHFLEKEDKFVDVGANVGHYSLLAAGVKSANVICVEPLPEAFQKLKKNIAINKLDKKINALNIGLSDSEGNLYFTTEKGTMNQVALTNTKSKSVMVEVYPLSALKEAKGCILLKIDVEGYELPVLRGAEEILNQASLSASIIELNGSGVKYGFEDEHIHELICEKGFSPVRYDPFKRFLFPLESYRKNQFNTLYVRDIENITKKIKKSPSIKIGNRNI